MSEPTRAARPASLADFWTTVTRDGCGALETLTLQVDGCRIDVVTNEARLRDRLRGYFGGWIERGATRQADIRIVALERPTLALDIDWTPRAPAPGRTLIDEESIDLPDGCLVVKRPTGMMFAFGGDLHLAVGRCLRNSHEVMNFVNDRYVHWRLSQGYLLAHASAVAQGGRCVALCGPPGSGKSTAALRLIAQGLDFVSDDRLLMQPSEYGVEVMGTPKHPRVNPGMILSIPALEGTIGPTDRIRLRALPPEELAALGHEYDVLIDDVEGAGRFATRGHLAAVVVFNWDATRGEPTATEVDLSVQPELLPLVVKSPGLSCESREPHVDLSPGRYLDVLSRRPVVEITGRRDFDAAARIAREVLERYI